MSVEGTQAPVGGTGPQWTAWFAWGVNLGCPMGDVALGGWSL